jgi:hypothetical protein
MTTKYEYQVLRPDYDHLLPDLLVAAGAEGFRMVGVVYQKELVSVIMEREALETLAAPATARASVADQRLP